MHNATFMRAVHSMRGQSAFLRLAYLLLCVLLLNMTAVATPKLVIFETDMTFDVDDVGALATLHALADQGKVELLAVMFNEIHPNGPAAIQAINSWYGRNSIPIGHYTGSLARPDASRYLEHVEKLLDAPANPQDSTTLYRKILDKQPDREVTIISVGFLNNLAAILKQDAQLIEAKVAELVVMGGRNRDNFNFVRHDLLPVSKLVLRKWPTPIAVTDFGHNVETGYTLGETDQQNPVREAYYRWFNQSFEGRASWDQVAVLYGVEGTANRFQRKADGQITFRDGDSLLLQEGWRYVIDPLLEVATFRDQIEALMTQPPRGNKLNPD